MTYVKAWEKSSCVVRSHVSCQINPANQITLIIVSSECSPRRLLFLAAFMIAAFEHSLGILPNLSVKVNFQLRNSSLLQSILQVNHKQRLLNHPIDSSNWNLFRVVTLRFILMNP